MVLICFFVMVLVVILQVLNKRCVEAAIKTALALQATVNKTSWFVRKHYFYPDLPVRFLIANILHFVILLI